MTSETPKKKHGGRPRGERVSVWVTPEEAAGLSDRAKQVSMSKSGYLRAVGLNQPVRSVADLHAVQMLAKVNGDLGRVAGLLKLWLVEKRGQGARPAEVEALMRDFLDLQAQVRDLMGKVIHDR